VLIGFSEENITPKPGYPLGGYIERFLAKQRAKGTLNDIYARAMYISDGSEEALIISAEVLAFDNLFITTTRRVIHEATGIPKEHIMLSATHTHSAPATIAEMILFKSFLTPEDLKLTQEYNEFLITKLLEASKKAKDNATQSELLLGKGRVKNLCTNRIDPNLEKDDEIVILTDSERRGSIISFTCHPTVLGADNLLYSGDFLSYTSQVIKSCTSDAFVPVYLNGAAGDQSTRFVRKNQSVEEAKRLGEILGKEVCAVLNNLVPIEGKSIRIKCLTAEVKVRNLEEERFRERIEKRIKELEELMKKASSEGERRKISQDLFTAQLILGYYEEFANFLKTFGEKIRIGIDILFIGENVAIVFIPLELFCRYGLEIKRKSGVETTIVACYSNGYYGYLPTETIYEHLDYEALMCVLSLSSSEALLKMILSELSGGVG